MLKCRGGSITGLLILYPSIKSKGNRFNGPDWIEFCYWSCLQHVHFWTSLLFGVLAEQWSPYWITPVKMAVPLHIFQHGILIDSILLWYFVSFGCETPLSFPEGCRIPMGVGGGCWRWVCNDMVRCCKCPMGSAISTFDPWIEWPYSAFSCIQPSTCRNLRAGTCRGMHARAGGVDPGVSAREPRSCVWTCIHSRRASLCYLRYSTKSCAEAAFLWMDRERKWVRKQKGKRDVRNPWFLFLLLETS